MKNKSKFLCLDCGKDTSKLGEFFFVKTELWLKVVNSKKGMLCIGCLEKRLKRKLVKSDFTNCFLNDPKHNKRMSLRLLNRLGVKYCNSY